MLILSNWCEYVTSTQRALITVLGESMFCKCNRMPKPGACAERISVFCAEGTLLSGHLQSQHFEINFSSICVCTWKEGSNCPWKWLPSLWSVVDLQITLNCFQITLSETEKRKMGRKCVVTVVYPKCITVEVILSQKEPRDRILELLLTACCMPCPIYAFKSGVEFIFLHCRWSYKGILVYFKP